MSLSPLTITVVYRSTSTKQNESRRLEGLQSFSTLRRRGLTKEASQLVVDRARLVVVHPMRRLGELNHPGVRREAVETPQQLAAAERGVLLAPDDERRRCDNAEEIVLGADTQPATPDTVSDAPPRRH